MAAARRIMLAFVLVACGAFLLAGISQAAAGARVSQAWASEQVAAVVTAGVMGPDVESFRASDPLTRGELFDALVALGRSPAVPSDPARLVSMRELDAQLVASLGLSQAARRIRVAARDAGLEPTAMLGSETVARLLGLRVNHPQAEEQLELAPGQPATRAEAAFSLARWLRLTPAEIERIDALTLDFSIAELDDWQRAVLSRALRFVGHPYVFAGNSERRQKLWSATAPSGSVTVPGGFDCSGFVWRVYKLEPFDGAPGLGETLQGRTSYAMSAEVPKAARIAIEELEPGDVVFFGARGPRSKPSEVDHMGIYAGNGWLVHSSSRGVALEPMTGWYETRFAWAKRPLEEAGLTGVLP